MQARDAIRHRPSRRRGIARTGILLAVGALGLFFAGLGTALFADLAPPPPTSVMLPTSCETPPTHARGWIGVMVEPSPSPEGYVRIRRVYPGMPAWHAGLLSGDLISEVDGRPVGDRSVAEVAASIRGEIDTPVRLTILRESCWGSHLEFRLVRQYWTDLEDQGYWVDYDRNGASATLRIEPRLWWSNSRRD